ncbi:hypothetical protein COT49_00115 [candidate division WWE3 bacterium CG08_land_8_20_14_0_20_40_13]|uniref:Histidine phosphatase family protein n=1 Tax=candidate division WWE3 bacterium CG08_land_8_20_14_0_20_40_13 TaxID=1975084 RepID=A0A2H0XEU8_UNCKA|nr:MAG: hypothetical protein COT49_00115 [candidate division WWE3 bacterium CG08_land_8_20_14_0_20_40_13]
MTEVFLLRHANAYDEFGFQEPDTPLRGKGSEQAQKLAGRLATCNIDVAYSSPYARARETAGVFSNLTGIKIAVDERLKEVGTEEWTPKDLENTGETIKDVLLEIVRKNRGKKIAIFAHGNLIKALLCRILHADFEAYNNLLVVSVASMTILHIEDTNQIKIVTVSDNAHEYLV